MTELMKSILEYLAKDVINFLSLEYTVKELLLEN